MNKKYLSIVSHYENCLAQSGDSHLGVDWPKKEDAETRYRIMLEIIKPYTDHDVRPLTLAAVRLICTNIF